MSRRSARATDHSYVVQAFRPQRSSPKGLRYVHRRIQPAFSVDCAIRNVVRVLVAEDETALAKQLTRALAAAGYAVDCAADGARAEFLGSTEQYDAVVLDLGL